MASLTYTDIQTRVMNELRLPTSNTTEAAKVAAVINFVYRDIAAKQDWWWLLKRAVVNTAVQAIMSSATVTNGSTSVTALVADSASTLATSLAGYVMLVPGDSNDAGAVYRVATHVAAATSLTLDAAYTGSTSTTAAPKFYQDAISLASDVGKLLAVKRYGEFSPLKRVGIEEMSQLKLANTTVGKPEVYSLFDTATTGTPTSARLLQIHPYPDKTYRLEYFYKQTLNTELSGTTEPLIPDDYRQVLVYGGLARGYAIFLNDLERSKFYQQLFNDTLALMAAQQREYTRDQAGVAPDDTYRRGNNRRRRVGGISLGDWFDRLPNIP